jgi:hypothetical protein
MFEVCIDAFLRQGDRKDEPDLDRNIRTTCGRLPTCIANELHGPSLPSLYLIVRSQDANLVGGHRANVPVPTRGQTDLSLGSGLYR